MRLPVNHALPLAVAALLIGGAAAYAKDKQPPAAPPVNGPAADYPVVVGAPFQVGSTTYTPEDKLNYDAVGYADVGVQGGNGITVAHKTLPLPSYAEVTSLDSGRTILVRVERRGPMSNDQLIELSPGAAAQLGVAGSANPAVRVRRVNPPEQERAMLRAGARVPERMETPKGLLDALNRKLNTTTGAPKPAVWAGPSATPAPTATPKPTSPTPKPTAAPKPVATPAPRLTPQLDPAPAARPVAANGTLVVQVAAFLNQASANTVAHKLGAAVAPAGRVFRVRMGPFANRAQAEAALAKAKSAGYSDARIQRAD